MKDSCLPDKNVDNRHRILCFLLLCVPANSEHIPANTDNTDNSKSKSESLLKIASLYPFTPPAVSPRINCLCKSRNTTTSGTDAITIPAITIVQFVVVVP